MTPLQEKRRKNKRKKFFRTWHRRIGFAASLFLFNLAITGFLLNHYEALGLHKSYVKSQWLLNWYDVKKPDSISCFTLDDDKLCHVDMMLIHSVNDNLHKLETEIVHPVALIKYDDLYYLNSATELHTFTEDFQLVESYSFSEDDTLTFKQAVLQNGNILLGNNNLVTHVFDIENFILNKITEVNIPEKTAQSIPLLQVKDKNSLNKLSEFYQQFQISHLKVIQDLHSGQILSTSGKLLTDLVAVIVLLLAISGFITWKRRKNNHR